MISRFNGLILISFLLALSCAEEGDISPNEVDRWEYFNRSDGLPSNQIYVLLEDRNEALWIGTDEGISEFDGHSFRNFDTTDGLVSEVIYAIAEDLDGNIWVGTDFGINIYIDEEWFYFPLFDGVLITSLLRLSNGDMLVGTEGFGAFVFRFDESDFFFYYQDNVCAACNLIYALYQDESSVVWLGTDGGLIEVRGNSATTYTTAQGMAANSVRSITGDNWGNIWIGMFDGSAISKYNNGKFETVNLANVLVQSWVWDFEVDEEGTLWVASAIGGLYRYDGAVMRKDFENLPDEDASALLEDSHGNIWIGTLFEGLVKYTP